MANDRTSKQIAERIDVNYYKRPSALKKRRRKLNLAAAVLSLLVIVVAFVLGDQRFFQAGAVSPAHDLFGNDCRLCHDSSMTALSRLGTFRNDKRSVSDESCLFCHDGPQHNDNSPSQSCADCHREHHGADQLNRVADTHCTACHSDLESHHPEKKTKFVNSVVNFNSHPEFAFLRNKTSDTTKIKFNHAVHLRPEGVFGKNQDPVILRDNCTYCHEPTEDRRYIKPIDFEKHCSECHSGQLTFDDNAELRSPVPHKSPFIVRGVLRDRYSTYVKTKGLDPRDKDVAAPNRIVPGRPKPSALSEKEWDWVNEALVKAETRLFTNTGGCKYCHQVDTIGTGAMSAWNVVAPNIPVRWFKNSQFRHDSHRLLDCKSCHEGVLQSTLTSDVLMPGVENCKICHKESTFKRDAARTDCIECHAYHDHSPSVERKFDRGSRLSTDFKKWKLEHSEQAKSPEK